ncbi:MAG: universal stress protein [Pseudomonadota bacterium]
MSRLLIIADPQEHCAATPRGLELAAKLGLAADVLAFTYESMSGLQVSTDEKRALRQRLLEQRRTTVRNRIVKYQRIDQDVKLRVIWSKDLHSHINRLCTKRDYYAVVKTGHRSESLTHVSLDWKLLRECPAPVLIVAKKRWHRAKPVLAALDLGTRLPAKRALNKRVLASAAHMATALGVDLEIITAIEVPVLLADLDLIDPRQYTRDAKQSMQPAIAELARYQGIAESAFMLQRGPVERVIMSRAAKIGAQIVVMGTVGRKGIRARLIGNTAEKVLQHLKTDVLAFKP